MELAGVGGVREGAAKPSLPRPVEQDLVLLAGIRDQGVEVAVAVEIAQRHVTGVIKFADVGSGEAALAVAEQDLVLDVVVQISDEGVELAVAVEVAQRNALTEVRAAGGVGGGETALAVAEQDLVGVVSRDEGVELAVAVEIAQRNGIAKSKAPGASEAVKPPLPSLSRIWFGTPIFGATTLFATKASSLPSPLKSPSATSRLAEPPGASEAVKPPAPSLSRIWFGPPKFATKTSSPVRKSVTPPIVTVTVAVAVPPRPSDAV